MTIIEFLDKSNIDNVCSAMIKKPERVIFVSNSKNGISKNLLDRYERFFKNRGEDIICEGLSLNPFKIDSVIKAFDGLTLKYEDCVFDLTGGNESYIVAASMVAARFPERRIQLHKINVSTGSVIDLDRDGSTILDTGKVPSITVAETVALNGGRIVYESERAGGTRIWDESIVEDRDVDTMWTIMRGNPTAWNSAVAILERFIRLPDGSLKSPKKAEDPKLPYSVASAPENIRKIFEKLETKGLIEITVSEGRETVRFSSENVERVLAKSGNLLELQVYRLALKAQSGGEKVFDDALTGVLIDIDGEKDDSTLTNEIDVILQKGLKPIFISCKNGDADNDELYKLRTVTARFGGKYAKAVLVLAGPRGEVSAANLKERAKEYHITVIDAYNMSDPKFAGRIARLE